MQSHSRFTKLVSVVCALSILTTPTLAATSVYKIYIPGLAPSDRPLSPANPTAVTATPAPALLTATNAFNLAAYPQAFSTQTTTLTNISNSPLQLSQGSFNTSQTALTPSADTCSHKYILPTESCTLTLSFTPPTSTEPSSSAFSWPLVSLSDPLTPTSYAVPISTTILTPPALTADITLPPAIANLHYEFDLNSLSPSTNSYSSPTTAAWQPVSELPSGLSFANNILMGTPPPGNYVLTVQRQQNSATTTHTLSLASLATSATLTPNSPTPLTTSVGVSLYPSYTLTNTGTTPLYTPLPTTLDSPQSLSFSSSSCPTLLLPSASCTLSAAYAPLAMETGSTTLTIPLRTPVTPSTSNPLNAQETLTASALSLHTLGSVSTPIDYRAGSSFGFTSSARSLSTTLPSTLTVSLADQLTTPAPQGLLWTLSNPLPPGLTLNSATGQITGTPNFLPSPWTSAVTASSPLGLATQQLTLSTDLHNIQVSSSSLNFGTIQTNTSHTLSALVINNGTLPELIGTPALYGTSDYTLETNCPQTLAPAQTCSVQVTFAPATSSDTASNSYIQFLLPATPSTSPVSSFSLISSAYASTSTSTSPVPSISITAFAASSASLSIPPQEPILNEPYTLPLMPFFSGITSSATWAADTLPQGLTLNNTTGTISGTPTALPPGGASSHAITLAYRSSPLLPLQRLTATLSLNFKDYSWSISKNKLTFDTLTFENQSATGWTNFAHSDQITITNTGNQPLTLQPPSIPPADLSTIATFASLATPPSQCTHTLAPAQTCALSYAYKPTQAHTPVSSNITLSSGRYSKTISLSLTAIHPLNLTSPTFNIYRNTYNSIPLNTLLTLGSQQLPPALPSNIAWALTPQSNPLPAPLTLNTSSNTIAGILSSTATSTTLTLSANYANNTNTTATTLLVQDAVLTTAPSTSIALWQALPTTTILTLQAPSTNTAPVSVNTVRVISQSHPGLTITPSSSCATLSPAATCTIALTSTASPSDTTVLGSQSASLFIDHTYKGSSLSTPAALSFTVKNPLSLNTPAPLSLLAAHPMTPLDFSTLASYLPTPSLNTDAFSWTLSSLPPGLSFNPSTQQLSGTPTSPATTTSVLTISYKGVSLSAPLSITVKPPIILADTESLAFGTLYQGTITSKTIRFTLPNGGNIQAAPSTTLPINLLNPASNCTPGLKAPDYSCTLTLTVHPSFTEEKLWTTNVSFSVLGASIALPVSFTVQNPLSLPDQETWSLLANQPQTLEQFGTLLQDARFTAPATAWVISAPLATSATISTIGEATLTPSSSDGTFTITATRNGAVISKTYRYTANPWPLQTTPNSFPSFYGYTTSPRITQTFTNTSTVPLKIPVSASHLVDPDPADLLTFTLTAQPCSGTTLAPAASCTLAISSTSKDISSFTPISSNTRFSWVPQPLTKPSRTTQHFHSYTSTSAPSTHPLSWKPIALQYAAPLNSFSLPLQPFTSNAANSAQKYTWSVSNLPAGLSLNTSTGTITGVPTAPPGTYTLSPTISYLSPTGTTLTATTSFTLQIINLSVAASALDFGLVYHDQTPTFPLTIQNTGTVPATLSSLSFPPSPNGVLSANTSSCPTLAVGASCTVNITLSPGSYGTLTTFAIASLTYNGLTATSNLPVSAVVLNPLVLNTSLSHTYHLTPTSRNLNPTLSHYALGNTLSPVSWSSANLPAGWTLSSAGVLSGTPSTTATLSFPITAQYASYSVSGTYTLPVQPLTLSTPDTISFSSVYANSTPSVRLITITNTSSTTLAHIKPTVPSNSYITFPANSCTTLVPGASCTLTLSFKPTVANPSYTSALSLHYGLSQATHTINVPITASAVNPLALSTVLPSPIIGLPFSYSLVPHLTSALGSITPSLIAWNISSPLPTGIAFNPATGLLSGLATTPQSTPLTITASYGGNSITQILPFSTIKHQLSLTPSSSNLGTLYQGTPSTTLTYTLTNQSYNAQDLTPVSAPFSSAPAITLSAPSSNITTSSTCPPALQPSQSCTLTLTLTPTTPENIVLTLSTSLGTTTHVSATASASLSAIIANPLSLAPATLPTLAKNITASLSFVPYLSHALIAAPTATWTSTSLPPGLVLNPSTGRITGVPATQGITSFTLTAFTSISSATQTYSLTVVDPGVVLTPATLDFGTLQTNWQSSSKTITVYNPSQWSQTITPSISTITAPYLTLDPSSTCSASLSPLSACQLTWVYRPAASTHSLNHNLTVSSTIQGYTVLQRTLLTGSAYNPLELSPALPTAFVGVPFSYNLNNNLSALNTSALDTSGSDWAGSTYRVNPSTGIFSLTPTSTAPVSFYAKATLRGNIVARTLSLTPIQATFALQATPSSINLGTVYTNSAPKTASVTLTNTGSYPAEITAPPSFSYTDANHTFTLTANSCPTEIQPGASCNLAFQYAPKSARATVSTTLQIPVGKNGSKQSTTSIAIAASAQQPLAFSSNVSQPILGIPYQHTFVPNITSVLEAVDPAQLSWTVDAGATPSGLTFSNGIVSGAASSTAPTTLTLSAYYKNNRITRTFTFSPSQITATQTPPSSDMGIVYPGTTKTATFTLRNTSATQPLTVLSAPTLSSQPSFTALSFNSCTAGKVLNPSAYCTAQVTFSPSSPTAALSATLITGIGHQGTITQWLQNTATMDSDNSMSWTSTPNQILSKGFPTSIDLRPYLNVSNIPNLSRSSITWTTSGTLPAGLTFSQGIISGTPTTLQSSSFQVGASYAGNSTSSNVFSLQVLDPVVFVPPPASPPLYASSTNPANFGTTFVEQTKTMSTTWRVNTTSTITAPPYIQTSPNGISILNHNCAPAGTVVPAGYTCSATVQLQGTASNIGNRSSKVLMQVGRNTTPYSSASAFITGTVLNPLQTYAQEQILSLAANTPLVHLSDVYVDRFPSATPVTVSIRSERNYNDPALPAHEQYPSTTLPTYIKGSYLTSGPLDNTQGLYWMIVTVTKHTAPALSVEQKFRVHIRKNVDLAVSVQAQQGQFAGYPANVTTYKITNFHPTDITPVQLEAFWTEQDANPYDSITSTSATDCIRTLPRWSSCTYSRTVNPGLANPNSIAAFSTARAFTYAPQPTTRPTKKATAFLYSSTVPFPSTIGNPPNHYLSKMGSAHILAEPLVIARAEGYTTPAMRHCDYFEGTPDTNRCAGFDENGNPTSTGTPYITYQPLLVLNKALNSYYTPGQYYSLSQPMPHAFYADAYGFIRGFMNYEYTSFPHHLPNPVLTYNVTLPTGRTLSTSVSFRLDFDQRGYGGGDTGGGGYNPSTDGPTGNGDTGTGDSGGGGGDSVGGEGE